MGILAVKLSIFVILVLVWLDRSETKTVKNFFFLIFETQFLILQLVDVTLEEWKIEYPGKIRTVDISQMKLRKKRKGEQCFVGPLNFYIDFDDDIEVRI